jgi:hypothetical protein
VFNDESLNFFVACSATIACPGAIANIANRAQLKGDNCTDDLTLAHLQAAAYQRIMARNNRCRGKRVLHSGFSSWISLRQSLNIISITGFDSSVKRKVPGKKRKYPFSLRQIPDAPEGWGDSKSGLTKSWKRIGGVRLKKSRREYSWSAEFC